MVVTTAFKKKVFYPSGITQGVDGVSNQRGHYFENNAQINISCWNLWKTYPCFSDALRKDKRGLLLINGCACNGWYDLEKGKHTIMKKLDGVGGKSFVVTFADDQSGFWCMFLFLVHLGQSYNRIHGWITQEFSFKSINTQLNYKEWKKKLLLFTWQSSNRAAIFEDKNSRGSKPFIKISLCLFLSSILLCFGPFSNYIKAACPHTNAMLFKRQTFMPQQVFKPVGR